MDWRQIIDSKRETLNGGRLLLYAGGIGCPESDKAEAGCIPTKSGGYPNLVSASFSCVYFPDEAMVAIALATCLTGCDGGMKCSVMPHSANSIALT